MAQAIPHEIDKAREIIAGLVGAEKIVLRPTKDRNGCYLTAEVAGDYAGLIPLLLHLLPPGMVLSDIGQQALGQTSGSERSEVYTWDWEFRPLTFGQTSGN